MEKIRKGNDIEVKWAIYAGTGINEAPYDLTGRRLSLFLKNQFGRTEIYEYEVEKHVIRFMFWGKDQNQTGVYSIELIENEGREGMHTVDECDAFNLVSHSCQTGGETEGRVECIHLQFRANMGISIPASDGTGAQIEVDNVLSDTSENPVQNKVITTEIKRIDAALESIAESVGENKDAILAVGEKYEDIDAKLASVSSDVSSLSEMQEELQESVTSTDSKLGAMVAKVEELESKVEVLEEKVDNYSPETPDVAETVYKSSITDKTLAMPFAVGGLDKGTTVEDLEGETFSEMFDDILFPTVYPTFTNPTATIAFKNYTSVKEVGSAAPSESNFTTSFSAGAITLSGVKQNDRAGELDDEASFIYVNGDADNTTLPTEVSLGSTTYKYRAYYGEGAQPKDNKGNDYDSPLSAGYVDSSAITLNGTYPWFASTDSATEDNPVVKQSLVAWKTTAGSMSTGNFELQPSGTLPQVFKLPRQLSSLQMLNTVSNKMETIGLDDYSETTETITIGSVDVTYYVYTYNGSVRGAVTLLAKF